MSNNDIIVETPYMPEYILEYYKENPFHIMGPDIVSLVDHGHQNPMNPAKPDKKGSRRRFYDIIVYYC